MDARAALRQQLQLTFERIENAVKDLPPGQWTASPQGLTPVVWQVGHVAATAARLLERAGRAFPVPAPYGELFASGSSGSAAWPEPQAVLRFFQDTHDALLQLTEGDLDRPVAPPPTYYRTVGEGLLQQSYHRGYHLGKIATLKALLEKAAGAD